MDRFHNRLRQIAFFENKDCGFDQTTSFIQNTPVALPPDPMGGFEAFQNRKFKLKSTWRCPPGPINLEAMIACNELQFNTRPTYKPPHKQNLSAEELGALKELINNTQIIIKPADKGSAVVIMNRADYLTEGFRQLSDTTNTKEG